jgi:predicted AAA+ superfamily ATPase
MEEAGILEKITRSGFCYPALNQVASIIRLDTQYGGGKTHGLISVVHAVRGMFGVQQIEEFVDPALLPKGSVRVAALDGENSDPADGLTLEGSLRAKTLWGELAWMPMQKKKPNRIAGRLAFFPR